MFSIHMVICRACAALVFSSILKNYALLRQLEILRISSENLPPLAKLTYYFLVNPKRLSSLYLSAGVLDDGVLRIY